jgi:hypothetical protein
MPFSGGLDGCLPPHATHPPDRLYIILCDLAALACSCALMRPRSTACMRRRHRSAYSWMRCRQGMDRPMTGRRRRRHRPAAAARHHRSWRRCTPCGCLRSSWRGGCSTPTAWRSSPSELFIASTQPLMITHCCARTRVPLHTRVTCGSWHRRRRRRRL